MLIRFLFYISIAHILVGCVSIPLSSKYKEPVERPANLEEYYSKGKSFGIYTEKVISTNDKVNQLELRVASQYGEILIDYFDHESKSDDLILVFPLLGGKPIVSTHFAKYFSDHGIDAAIIRRNDDFKNPANFDRIEEMLRESVVRDRIALDFFEQKYQKKNFGGFGVSRGAINLAMSAGVDPRLKYSFIAMGASDLPLIFKHSNEGRIKKYVKQVMDQKSISKSEFYAFLEERVKTDPKAVAKHIDAKNTLMLLCVFDETVPYEYGRRLRKAIGNPRTIFLLSNHYTVVAFTQIFSLIPPGRDGGLFPFNYIELESLEFFRKSFNQEKPVWGLLPFKIIRLPFDLVGYALEKIF